jgi:hypothetical protein
MAGMLESGFTCSRLAMEAGKRLENRTIVTAILGGAILLARRAAVMVKSAFEPMPLRIRLCRLVS